MNHVVDQDDIHLYERRRIIIFSSFEIRDQSKEMEALVSLFSLEGSSTQLEKNIRDNLLFATGNEEPRSSLYKTSI